MMQVEDLENLKLFKRRFVLPKPENGKGNLIFLPYMSPTDCNLAIQNSGKCMTRMNNWKYIYREYRYGFKLFNKMVRFANVKNRNDILLNYQAINNTLKPTRNLSIANGKNCYIDLSFYMEYFFNVKKYAWKKQLIAFFNLLGEAINKDEYKDGFDKKYLLIELHAWGIDKIPTIMKYNVLNNPISMIYLAMRKNLSALDPIKDTIILITDGDNKTLKVELDKLDKNSYLEFKLAMNKFNGVYAIPTELDDDNHLETYGTVSEAAPKAELEVAKSMVIAEDKLSNGESIAANEIGPEDNLNDDNTTKSILDRINDIKGSGNSELNLPKGEDEEEEPEEDNLDDILQDNNEDETSKPKDTETDERTEDEKLEDELTSEILDDENSEELRKEVHELISTRVPDKPVSAREKMLREKQMQLKLSSGKTLKEILEEEKFKPSSIEIKTTDVSKKINTLNPNIGKLRFNNFEESYNKNGFDHDFYGIFNSLSKKKDLPIYIKKVEKVDSSDSMNLKDTYTFKLEDPTYHREHTFKIDVPKFIDNKFMYLAGNKKVFIKQLILKPLVKIAPDTIQICSNYSKIFMFRYGENVSPKMQNLIKVISSYSKFFTVKKGNCVALNEDYKTTIEYDCLAKEFLNVKIKNSDTIFIFSQPDVDKFIEANEVKRIDKINRDVNLIIGFRKNKSTDKFYEPLVVLSDDASTVSADFNNGPDIDPESDKNNLIDIIVSELHKHNASANIEQLFSEMGAKIGKRYVYSRCRIMKKFVPTILLVSYFEGLENVLKKAEIKYEFTEKRPKFATSTEKLDKGVIQFSDGYLVFERYPIQNSLLMNSFTLFDTRAYAFKDMNTSKDPYLEIFNNLFNSRIIASAFDAFYDNMIDPITEEILDSMNLPTDFVGLILAANTLLADNNYSSEINMTNFRVRSNEMVNAMLYKIVATAFSKYKRTAANRSPIKISVPQSALIREIVMSQSVEDYSILNPVVESEKTSNITCKGPNGINLDESYTEEKRSFDDSMLGLLAISTSPDANCGVVRKCTMDPKVVSARGYIDTTKTTDDLHEENMFSVCEMLTPLGVRRDDSIRTAMASKQSGHIIPVHRMDSVLISNGMEKALPYRLSSDFVVTAEHDGVVKSYDDKTKIMIIEYQYKENGKNVTKAKAINLASSITKNGAGGFFLAMSMKPYVKVGAKFKAQDILASNGKYFDQYSDGVKFQLGTLCKVACLSDYDTYEDSTVISERLSSKLSSEISIEKHAVLGAGANLLKLVKPGDKVSVNDILLAYDQAQDDESIDKLLSNLSDDLKNEVSELSKNVIRSKYTGWVSDVQIYTDTAVENLSPSLQKVVKEYWAGIRNKKNILKKNNITDPSDTGGLYIHDDKPIEKINGKIKGYDVENGVLILIYVTYVNTFGVGDKLINYSALKGVCSSIIETDKTPYSEFRPYEEISAFFPPSGVLGRMITSIFMVCFGNKLLVELKRKLGDIYFGKPYDYTQDFDYHEDGMPDNPRAKLFGK